MIARLRSFASSALFLALGPTAVDTGHLFLKNDRLWQVENGTLAGVLLTSWVFSLPFGLAASLLIHRLFKRRFFSRLATIANLLTILFIALTYSFPAPNPQSPIPNPDSFRPNILLITLDTTRRDHLGSYGHDRAYTPNLDRLAREGGQLTEARTAVPRTGPAHGTLLGGVDPVALGALRNGFPPENSWTSLSENLTAAGYTCGAVVSSWTLKHFACGLGKGFRTYDDSFAPAYLPVDEASQLWSIAILHRLGFIRASYMSSVERRAPETTDRALEWLTENSTSPFFLWVHYFDPHTPYNPPPPWNDLPEYPEEKIANRMGLVLNAGKQKALYDGEIALVDREIGRLLRFLLVNGLGERTEVVITSDHGESLTEHNYYFEHGDYLFETCLEVPLLWRVSSEETGLVEGEAELSDLAPWMGRLAAGESQPFLPGNPRERLSVTDTGTFGLKQGSWKCLLDPDGSLHLYDLETDPAEMRDLAAERPDVVQELREPLRRWQDRCAPLFRALPLMDRETEEKLRSLGYLNH